MRSRANTNSASENWPTEATEQHNCPEVRGHVFARKKSFNRKIFEVPLESLNVASFAAAVARLSPMTMLKSLHPQICRYDIQIGAYDASCLRQVPGLNYCNPSQLFSEIVYRYDTIESGPLNNGRVDVPSQSNSWSCGINGAARMLAMLGQPLPDYKTFHDHSPNHPVAHAETGPGTLRLSRYINEQRCCRNELGEVFIGPNMTDDWHSQEQVILQSLELSRPIFVLVEVGSRKLHWINLVGRQKGGSGDFLVMNSDGYFYQIDGGISALQSRMDLDRHAVHKIPLANDRIARFNSISATCGSIRPHRAFVRHMWNADRQVRGDRNAGHNVVNTIMDSPINPHSLIWKLF